ncbi:hypothetical protein ACHAXR_010943 [Thalassiosira sp. AJA248-18]
MIMNLAIRIAAAVLSVPPDVLAPMVRLTLLYPILLSSKAHHFASQHKVPMMAPPPRNALEFDLRNEVDGALSGRCSSADGSAPLFAISREEVNFVNCNSGLPHAEEAFRSENDIPDASTYGEITSLGARQLFHHMGLTKNTANANMNSKPNYQFFDLGSGGGRLVLQSHLELPSVFKSVGIELSPSRHNIAVQTWENLVESGDALRIRKLAERSWGMKTDSDISTVKLHEGDLFELDISQATHLYLASLCFSEDMLERLVDKIAREGTSLQIVASLRVLPLLQDGKVQTDEAKIKHVSLGSDPWMEFVEMSWTKARGDGCPVYFYSVKNINDESQ